MELLESEHSNIEDIEDSDTLISFYTGFVEFLEPVVNELTYWGSKSWEAFRATTYANISRPHQIWPCSHPHDAP